MSDESIKVLLADDHALVRETLANWLSAAPGIQVVAAVSEGDAALTEARKYQPDVALLDIDMPGLSCFDCARQIREASPKTRIIVLSAFFHDRYIEQALAVEAAGYITKNEPTEHLIEGIRKVAAGGVFFSADVQSRIVVGAEGAGLADRKQTRVSTLTPRELEVLRYIARGMSKKEIANLIHISAKTVDHHTANLMSKLDIHDRVELARLAIREGLTQP